MCDYRALPGAAAFDKVVRVGMVEHVGRARLPVYVATASRLLRPGGLFLNHGIVTAAGRRDGRATWVARRLAAGFIHPALCLPDGELLPPGEMLAFAEAAGFETRDVESLREHDALALRHWVRRLDANHGAAALAGETTYRVWRLSMAGSGRVFATGCLGIVQALFSKAGPDGACSLPLTRADLYAAPDAPAPDHA